MSTRPNVLTVIDAVMVDLVLASESAQMVLDMLQRSSDIPPIGLAAAGEIVKSLEDAIGVLDDYETRRPKRAQTAEESAKD